MEPTKLTPPRPTRILVADDDAEVRALLRRILEEAGYLVDCVSDGAEALERLRRERPDVLILDLAMPEVDGWAVLAALSRMGDSTPVVIVSAFDPPDSLRHGALAGNLRSWITKPFSFHDLLLRCREALGSRASDVTAPAGRRTVTNTHR